MRISGMNIPPFIKLFLLVTVALLAVVAFFVIYRVSMFRRKMPMPLISGLQNRSDEKLPDMSWIGVVLGILMCSLAIYFQVEFRHSLAVLPPGTTIRPMGFAILEIAPGFGGLLLGVPCSVLGILVARAERKRISLWLGIAGLIFNLLPLPIAKRMSDQTLSTTTILMSP